jgi:hypothetical protein
MYVSLIRRIVELVIGGMLPGKSPVETGANHCINVLSSRGLCTRIDPENVAFN